RWSGRMRCSRCGTENAEGRAFCRDCGSALGTRCPSCGAEVPAATRFCPACGAAVNSPDPTAGHALPSFPGPAVARDGERKLATVLFCDIVDSTALTERLGAEAMHGLMKRFYELALAEVHRYGGRVASFLGDGFMGLVGIPVAREDHARRGVLAALGIRQRLEARPLEAGDGPVEIALRMGLNTGMVVVGGVGDDLDSDLAAIGEPVNVAHRLMKLAEPGGILVGDTTARLVSGYI